MVFQIELEVIINVVLSVTGITQSVARLVLGTVCIRDYEPVVRNVTSRVFIKFRSLYMVAQGRLSMIRWTKYSLSILYPASLLAFSSQVLSLHNTLHCTFLFISTL